MNVVNLIKALFIRSLIPGEIKRMVYSKTNLETSWAPVHKLDSPLGLD